MNRSDYTVVAVTPTKVFLVDNDLGNKSVTNDAENVTKEIFEKYGRKNIIYMDSMGRWDELKHVDGRFTDFGTLDQPTKEYVVCLKGILDNKYKNV
jgi:hypothetical protein